MKLAVTGCPRNCAEAYVKDVGVVAIEGGRWEIYVGGAAGRAHPQGRPALPPSTTPTRSKLLTGRFLQYYRENAKWLERTYAFVPRVGIEHIRARRRRRQRGHRRASWTPRMQNPSTPTGIRGRRARSRPPPASSAPRCRWRCCRRCRGPGRELLGGPWCTADRRSPDRRRAPARPAGPDPVGEGRAFGVDGEQVAVFRLRRRQRCAPSRRSARTGAARSPTARSTTASCSARCT